MCGEGKDGQLGLNEASNVYLPERVLGEVSKVACGDKHTLILLLDGHLLATGDNSKYQLGV